MLTVRRRKNLKKSSKISKKRNIYIPKIFLSLHG